MLRSILFSCLYLTIIQVVSAHNVFSSNEKKNWAILVAGSNGWYNYRHQSDVCHSYHLLLKRGIPPENIITFMFDDIAHNEQNPFPGKLFNDYKHKDVYEGVRIDYKGYEVTPQMFMRVMKGDTNLKNSGKKVLDSGPEDNIFVFFTDHGAEGLIAFPNSDLYALDLNNTISFMYENQRYKQMVLYIEACYSGSMFEEILSPNVKVFTTTAANSKESSYAAFCEDNEIMTCLADEYSYNWMIDTEHHRIKHWTLQEQFESVKHATAQSHVMEYGDMDISFETVSKFQSHNLIGSRVDVEETAEISARDTVPAEQAHLFSMRRQIEISKTPEERRLAEKRLERAVQMATTVEHIFEDVLEHIKQKSLKHHLRRSNVEELNCFRSVFEAFKNKCFTIQQVPEVAKHTSKLHQLCRKGYSEEALIRIIYRVCG